MKHQTLPQSVSEKHVESDESLRSIYGESALFSRVGSFTLVHLDRPSADEIARRNAEFDPNEFFFDDCPLCISARESGGHIVFDATDSLENSDGDDAASFLLDRALNAFSRTAEVLGNRLGPDFPPRLAERYFEDVEMLNERFVDALGEAESVHHIEAFEQQMERAARTLVEVAAAEPALARDVESVQNELDRLSTVWRDI